MAGSSPEVRTTILIRVAAVLSLSMLVACSGGNDPAGSTPARTDPARPDPTTAAGPAVSGGPCTTADARLTIDGVEHICMLKSEKLLVWTSQGSAPSVASTDGGSKALTSSADIPATIENWGFDLRPFDPATGKAGVMQIAGVLTPPQDSHDTMDSRYLFMDYGVPDSGSADLQMPFFLPLGTPVVAMADGVVCDVPKLYSGDYSVRIAPTGIECTGAGQASVMFETEHVINPLVQQGETITAGTQVATVSDYHQNWAALGLGIVEIGVSFNQGNDGSPWHACPARFLDPTKATELTAALASIHAAWEAEQGDTTMYDEAAQSPLGCTTLEDIQG